MAHANVDYFSESGSTFIAAVKIERHPRLIEFHPLSYDTSIWRGRMSDDFDTLADLHLGSEVEELE